MSPCAARLGNDLLAPRLLSGGNPQIPKGEGESPVKDYMAAMPGWKRELGVHLDSLIVRTVPEVRKAVKWNQPFYGWRWRNLVPLVPLLHRVRPARLLPRGVPRSASAQGVQAPRSALLRHSRRRRP